MSIDKDLPNMSHAQIINFYQNTKNTKKRNSVLLYFFKKYKPYLEKKARIGEKYMSCCINKDDVLQEYFILLYDILEKVDLTRVKDLKKFNLFCFVDLYTKTNTKKLMRKFKRNPSFKGEIEDTRHFYLDSYYKDVNQSYKKVEKECSPIEKTILNSLLDGLVTTKILDKIDKCSCTTVIYHKKRLRKKIINQLKNDGFDVDF